MRNGTALYLKMWMQVVVAFVVCMAAIGALSTEIVAAATIHVDWDTGSNISGCGSQANPCKTPQYANDTSVSAGDTVLLHSRDDAVGVYHNNCSTVLGVTHANTTWKAASGETVWISTTPDHSSAPYSYCGNKGVATIGIGVQGVTIDGINLWGSILISASGDNTTIQNCDLSGGNDYQGFPALIRTTGQPVSSAPPTDWCENLLVRNCILHDNKPALAQGATNDTLVLTYGAKGVVIENCEFYNALNIGIKFKDHSNMHTARNNYFHDLKTGVQGNGQWPDGWIDIYNNIFANISGQAVAVENGAVDYFRVRNNTFFNTAKGIGWWHAGGMNVNIFNNIHYHSVSGQRYHDIESGWTAAYSVYLDYNNYYSTQGTSWNLNNRNVASNVTEWKNHLNGAGASANNGDAHATSINPNFVNASGSFSRPDDFKLTTYPQNGRGGVWPAVMGAYVTGNEVVGYSSTRLNSPRNLRAQ